MKNFIAFRKRVKFCGLVLIWLAALNNIHCNNICWGVGMNGIGTKVLFENMLRASGIYDS